MIIVSRFFIFHGFEGSSTENWNPWLKQELEKLGHEVIVPDFPHPEKPIFSEWMDVVDGFGINENDTLIGHSLGAPFALSVVEKYKVKKVILVAGFVGKLNLDIDEFIVDFTQKVFDFEKIKANCSDFVFFNSDDDPYVPIVKGWELEKNLGGELVIVKGAGHFNQKSGYLKFEKLYQVATK